MNPQLSVVIITYNEQKNIHRCLNSVQGIADEIVVVDSFSTDRTQEICEEFGVRFIQHAFEGHIQQKNFAIDKTSYDWVLSLDADEALSDELKESIIKTKNSPNHKGYKMNRLTNYCGTWVKHCGWYPDTKVRLVNKHFARWQGVNPHDRLDMLHGAKVGFLKGDILHYSYYTRADHYKQIEYFGDIAARELHQQGKRIGILAVFGKVCAQFIKSYVLKRGFLDGLTGLSISKLSAYATFRKYSKLRALYKNANQ